MIENSPPPLSIRWAEPNEYDSAATFITAAIQPDPGYISHGEIQTGLSTDGRSWVPDLAEKMRADFSEPGPDRRIVVAFEADNLVCVGVVLKCADERASYVVIEDIAVSPTARSGGIGRRVMTFVEDQARAWGSDWAFMESGIHNDRAHAFFERLSYQPISKVFAKAL